MTSYSGVALDLTMNPRNLHIFWTSLIELWKQFKLKLCMHTSKNK